jgi:hypothetical protein
MGTDTSRSAIRAATVVWLLLLAGTLVGWALTLPAQQGRGISDLAKGGVIVTAFVKIWLVGFQFMELRGAPRILRHAFDAWALSVCATLIVILCG